MKRAIIIGGGLGGLATGIHLQRRGWSTRILEQNRQVGGRMNRLEADGFRVDTGPTLLMMPEVLTRIFADAGRRMEEYLTLERLEPAYEVRFGDGRRLRMGGSVEAMTREVARFDAGDAARFPRFVAAMAARYRRARGRFIERSFNDWGDLLHPQTLGGLAGSSPWESVARFVGRHLRDERLRAAFTFQTLYLGTSPERTPSIYGFLPYIEMEFGVWFPRGGTYAVAEALGKLYADLGGRVQCETAVTEILLDGDRARGVRDASGAVWDAEVVVANADLPTVYRDLLPASARRVNSDARLSERESGCSGFLLYLGVHGAPEGWPHHVVLLPDGYREALDAIFRDGAIPEEPALYACVPTRTDPTLAPPGCHVLYLLVPTPHLEAPIDWTRAAGPLRERVLDIVEGAGWSGLRRSIVMERAFTPLDFQRTYGCFRGSAFGLASTFLQSAYFRPHNRSEDVRDLYFVGASTHPGGGVPIVLTSARLVAETIEADAAARARRPVARDGKRWLPAGSSEVEPRGGWPRTRSPVSGASGSSMARDPGK